MKKLLLLAGIALLGFNANAQEEKKGLEGTWWVAGQVAFGSEKTGDIKESSSTVLPIVGYFIAPTTTVGVGVGMLNTKAENGSVDTQDMSALTVGAFGRYYMTPASQFSLFGEFGVDYSSIDNKLADYKVNGIDAGLGLGMNYFVSSNFSIEAGVAVLGFSSEKADVTGADGKTGFNFGGDWRAVTFGVNYKF